MKTVAVVNQKGGVGKTTTVVNLAAAIARPNRPVLLVDLDPQGNASSSLGLKGQQAESTLYAQLTAEDGQLETAILATSITGLAMVPSNRDLAASEIELIGSARREHRLADLLQPLDSRFAFALLDCPPSLGLLTINALVAAESVLIPLNCEYFALEGLADLFETLRRVRGVLNPELDIEGVLLTMADDRTNLGQQVGRDVRRSLGDRVYRTVIPRNIRLAEAPSHGIPAIAYDPRSRGAEAYAAFAREFLGRQSSAGIAGRRG